MNKLKNFIFYGTLFVGSLFAFKALSDLKSFKGVSSAKEGTEAQLQNSITQSEFCCDRSVKSGDAHSPRYDIKQFLVQQKKSLMPNPSKGKK